MSKMLRQEHFAERPIISKSRFRLHRRNPHIFVHTVLGFTLGFSILLSIDLWLVSIANAFLMMTIDHHDGSSIQRSSLIIK